MIYAGLKEPEFPGSLEDADEQIREEGGGRKKATETQPGLLDALNALVDHEITRQLAKALTERGLTVSRQLISKLLNEMGFSLQANQKVREGSSSEDRDAQFKHLNELILRFQGKGQPAISVDTKKKELVGEFKNGGREFQPKGKPEKTNVHDFMDKKLGKAVPYGVYDMIA